DERSLPTFRQAGREPLPLGSRPHPSRRIRWTIGDDEARLRTERLENTASVRGEAAGRGKGHHPMPDPLQHADLRVREIARLYDQYLVTRRIDDGLDSEI